MRVRVGNNLVMGVSQVELLVLTKEPIDANSVSAPHLDYLEVLILPYGEALKQRKLCGRGRSGAKSSDAGILDKLTTY